jgi:16S rRNA (cytosine967-C5)-methyltransferase
LSENDDLGLKYNPNLLLSKIYPNIEINIQQFVVDFLTLNDDSTLYTSLNWLENSKYLVNELSKKYNDNLSSITDSDLGILYSCPEWIIEDLNSSNVNASEFCKSTNSPAPVCIRVSDTLHTQAIENMLVNKEIPFSYSKLVPNCIILHKRAKIDDTIEYKNGLFEVQDEGSQLIAYSLAPQPGDIILDACAGAGGKTLHIANICPDATEIVASDSDFLRIKEFSKRLSRYNAKNITIKHAKSMEFDKLNSVFKNQLFDSVLIDAPCTGLGTIRRDPMKKYKITSKIAEKMQQKQLEILTAYSKFVKPGGILVYATCSVLSIENQSVIERFLSSDENFCGDSLADVFENYGIKVTGLKPDDFYLNLMPHIHGTDGFFMARMKKLI